LQILLLLLPTHQPRYADCFSPCFHRCPIVVFFASIKKEENNIMRETGIFRVRVCRKEKNSV
jgi:hypothetical protein